MGAREHASPRDRTLMEGKATRARGVSARRTGELRGQNAQEDCAGRMARAQLTQLKERWRAHPLNAIGAGWRGARARGRCVERGRCK